MTPRSIRRIILWWQNRKTRKAMFKAVPKLREYARQEAEYRRQHRAGSARIAKAKRDAVLNVLAGRA